MTRVVAEQREEHRPGVHPGRGRGRLDLAGGRRRGHARHRGYASPSTIVAMPWPTPMHIVASP